MHGLGRAHEHLVVVARIRPGDQAQPGRIRIGAELLARPGQAVAGDIGVGVADLDDASALDGGTVGRLRQLADQDERNGVPAQASKRPQRASGAVAGRLDQRFARSLRGGHDQALADRVFSKKQPGT